MELKSDSPMDDGEMAILGQKLANLGLAFAGGNGWPPFAVMAHLQERGLITGVFHEIRWTSPNTWTVT